MNRYLLQFRKEEIAPIGFDSETTKSALYKVLIFLRIKKGVLTEKNFKSHGGKVVFRLQGRKEIKIQIFPPKKK